jgi:hypothetical protein
MEESLSFDHDYVGHNNLYILNLLKRQNKHNYGHAIESDIYCKSGNRWSGRVVFPTIYRLVIAKSLIVELSVKYIV